MPDLQKQALLKIPKDPIHPSILPNPANKKKYSAAARIYAPINIAQGTW
jgi:hypothetical protein